MKIAHHRTFIMIITLFLQISCMLYQEPASSLGDVEFAVFPHIVNRKGEYYLIYKIDVSTHKRISTSRPVYAKTINGKAYYYFSKAINHTESGALKVRPLELDGFTEFAGKDEVYWLNKDSSEVKLLIVWEK